MAKRFLMSIDEFFRIDPPKPQIGIPCGQFMCVSCCIEEFMVCGAEVECDASFNSKLVFIVLGVTLALVSIAAYLVAVQVYGSKNYTDIMA